MFPIYTRIREVDPAPVDLVATYEGEELLRYHLTYDRLGIHWADNDGRIMTASGGTFTFQLPKEAVIITRCDHAHTA
jgi:hypothetical protein